MSTREKCDRMTPWSLRWLRACRMRAPRLEASALMTAKGRSGAGQPVKSPGWPRLATAIAEDVISWTARSQLRLHAWCRATVAWRRVLASSVRVQPDGGHAAVGSDQYARGGPRASGSTEQAHGMMAALRLAGQSSASRCVLIGHGGAWSCSHVSVLVEAPVGVTRRTRCIIGGVAGQTQPNARQLPVAAKTPDEGGPRCVRVGLRVCPGNMERVVGLLKAPALAQVKSGTLTPGDEAALRLPATPALVSDADLLHAAVRAACSAWYAARARGRAPSSRHRSWFPSWSSTNHLLWTSLGLQAPQSPRHRRTSHY